MQSRNWRSGALFAGALALAAGFALRQPAAADQAKAFACPEMGDPSDVTLCYDDMGKPKPGFPKFTPAPFDGGEDVNGDGKKDRLGSKMTDAAGNMVECWCLQKSDKTPQQFAYAFVPAGGGGRKWFGGCYFPNAWNDLKCDGEVVKDGPDKGKIKEYTKVTQMNIDWGGPTDRPPTGTKDKHFCYFNSGPNKGKIKKTLTEGRWVKDGDKYRYETTKSTECPIKDPPAQPQDLLALVFTPGETGDGPVITMHTPGMVHADADAADADDAEAVLAPSGDSDAPAPAPVDPDTTSGFTSFPGVDYPPAVVVANTDSRPNWQYRLLIPPPVEGFGDSASRAGFITAPEISIHAGDEFTLTGTGIRLASVDPSAAQPAMGGWVLTEFNGEHASFRATADARPAPGTPIGPFVLVSDAPAGVTRWGYAGADVGMSYVTVGPSDQPTARRSRRGNR